MKQIDFVVRSGDKLFFFFIIDTYFTTKSRYENEKKSNKIVIKQSKIMRFNTKKLKIDYIS